MKALFVCVMALGLSSAAYSATPAILANNVGNPDNIIIDASSVYWDDLYTGQISSVSINPGGAVTNYPVAMVGGGDLAQDNVSLYFAGAANTGPYLSEHFAYKTSKAGGLTNTINNGMDYGFAYGGSLTIGPVGGLLYYIGGFRSIPGEINNLYLPIVSLSTQGGSDNALIYDDPDGTDEAIFQQDGLKYWLGSIPNHFSTDSTFLYWSDSDTTGIWQLPLIGGAATAIVSGRNNIQVIATPTTGAAAGSIFWVEGTIGSASLMRREVGGQIITVLAGDITAASKRCFAVDDDLVYCEQNGGIVQVSINDGATTVVASAAEAFGPIGLAVDTTYVYWSNLIGQILRTGRPTAGSGTPPVIFKATGSLGTARAGHTQTLLPSGKVLVAGGVGTGGSYLASAEIYDPVTGTWAAAGSFPSARAGHAAIALPNGKVLIAGGYNGSSYFASAEIYDPASGSWTSTGGLGSARSVPTATLLPSGKVLVVGGSNGNGALASAEIYDPASGKWTPTGSLNTPRFAQTATLLTNGKVLVAGGSDGSGLLASAETYDPASGKWTLTGSLAKRALTAGSLNIAREGHTATLLPNGQMLVAGGLGANNSVLASAELYDPTSGAWSATGNLATARVGHTATLLSSGQVLVAGGSDSGDVAMASAELYDFMNGTWTAAGSMLTARVGQTATLQSNGQVLVAGGLGTGRSYLSSAEVYDSAPPPSQSLNISTRGDVETGDGVLIGGFIVTGTEPKQVIIRALGPSLSLSHVSGVLANPTLELHNSSGAVIATNDNWKDNSAGDQATIINQGLNLYAGSTISDAESILVQTLAPGSYTGIVSGAAGGTGIGLVEVYDVDAITDGQLANISTRGFVGTSDNLLIGGFILGPGTGATATVIVRAIGPSLAANGVTNPLLDPTLVIDNADGDVIASNDNWMDSPDAATITSDGLAPTNSNESALLITPGPGGYTAIVSGVGSTTGIGLVEVYNLK
ncbi:MAG: kelch repeat-containing protein [Chthoniobacterales bacterium]